MKFSKLAALARRKKSMFLISTYDPAGEEVVRQHLLIESAMYPLDGMPVMNADELLAAIDAPKDKRNEYYVHEKAMDMMLWQFCEDNPEKEEDAEATLLSVMLDTFHGSIIPAQTPWGIRFIEAEYKQVLSGEKGVAWWARRTGEKSVALIAKRGYQTICSIATTMFWIDERNLEEMKAITRKMCAVMDERKKADGEQQQM